MLETIENYLKDWLKENKEEFIEEGLEGVILPALLSSIPGIKEIPYLLDIFPFDCEEIVFSGRYNHTNYKTPTGINYDAYCKYEGMEIKINKGSFSRFFGRAADLLIGNKEVHGINTGVIDIMFLKFLGAHQTKFPILFKSSKFVGPVMLLDWNINEAEVESYFNATFKQTSLRRLKTFEYKGEEGKTIDLGHSNLESNLQPKKNL